MNRLSHFKVDWFWVPLNKTPDIVSKLVVALRKAPRTSGLPKSAGWQYWSRIKDASFCLEKKIARQIKTKSFSSGISVATKRWRLSIISLISYYLSFEPISCSFLLKNFQTWFFLLLLKPEERKGRNPLRGFLIPRRWMTLKIMLSVCLRMSMCVCLRVSLCETGCVSVLSVWVSKREREKELEILLSMQEWVCVGTW